MPLEQTITVINKSGKIISSGKQLLSLFKEAKASYEDKKAHLKAERVTLNRSHTFDTTRSHNSRHTHPNHLRHQHSLPLDEPEYPSQTGTERHNRSRPPVSRHGRLYDEFSEASSRKSSKPRRSRSVGGRSHASSSINKDYDQSFRELRKERSKHSLTELNLRDLDEITSQAPERASAAYRSPYAETIPLDAMMSKMDLTHTDLRNYAHMHGRASPEPRENASIALSRRQSFSSGFLQAPDFSYKEIDMNLAYGNIPPDLENRIDLDPAYQEAKRRERAQALVRKVEGLLDEAHCVRHGATTMISQLQKNPDQAASVALTLAELSSAIGKMSPSFLPMLKGASPAVFGLLASPQFLIGTGIAVGVTVVMFGGWKIVKKVKEQNDARKAIAFSADRPFYPGDHLPRRTQTESEMSAGIDEAFVVDDDLSTIETWRRGIMPYGVENESADYELMTPEARRVNKEKHDTKNNHADTKSRKTERTGEERKKKKTSGSSSAHGSSSKSLKREKLPASETRSVASSTVGGKSQHRKTTKLLGNGTRSRTTDDDSQSIWRMREPEHRNMLKAVFKKKEEERSEVMIV